MRTEISQVRCLPAYGAATRCAVLTQGAVPPVVVAISKMEDAALYCTDVEGMVAKMAKVLSKSSFFPVALGSEGNRGEGMCRDASRMAVLQVCLRACICCCCCCCCCLLCWC